MKLPAGVCGVLAAIGFCCTVTACGGDGSVPRSSPTGTTTSLVRPSLGPPSSVGSSTASDGSPPPAPVPPPRVNVFTIDIPGAGTVSYALVSPSCRKTGYVANLRGGGRVTLDAATLTVAIPGLARRSIPVAVTPRPGHTVATGTATDGSAVSIVFPC